MSGPRLNRRLTLESPERTPDGQGGYSEGWTARGVLWAEVTARSGRETSAVGAPVSRVGYRIVVRGAPIGHPERPTVEQRFRDGSRIFPIRAVTEQDGSGRYLVCFADEEVVA